VVAEREVRFPARLVLAALQDLENELVALFAVLADQRFDVLERGRLQRLEAVALVHTTDDPEDMLAAADVVRQEVAGAARGFGSQVGTTRSGRRTSESRPLPRRPGAASLSPGCPS